NFNRLQRSQFSILDGPGIQLEMQLEQYQPGMANLLGGGLNSTRTVLLRPIGGLGNSSLILLNRDARGVDYAEQNLSLRAKQGTTQTIEEIQIPLYQSDNKLIFVLNQEDSRRQFSLSVPALDTVATRSMIFLASNQEFGSVTTAIEIEGADLPTGTTTKPVNVSISGAGMFEITVTNLSSSALAWSLGNNAPTTGLSLKGYSPVLFSLGTTMASSSDRRIFQASRSTIKLLLIHEVASSLNFSLQFETVADSLITAPGDSVTVTPSQPAQTEEEFLRIAGGGGGGCFIATAAFGDKEAWVVKILSRFRDNCLLKTQWGTEFVAWYYATSPPIAQMIADNKGLRYVVQILLLPLLLLAITGLILVEGGIVLFIMLIVGCALNRRWLAFAYVLCMLAVSQVFANSGVQSALTTAQIQDIGQTLQSIASNAFRYYGSVQPAFSNPEDNTLNVVLYDIKDGSDDPSVQIGSYFSPIDQLRVPSLSDRNRQSNFGNVLYLDLNPLNPLLSRSVIESGGVSKISTAALYANQQVFYQRYSRALSKLIQFQKQNPKDRADVKSLFENGFWLEDDRWLTEALAIFASFRFPRGNEIVFNADSALKVFENNQPLGDLIMDSRLGTQGPLEVSFLLHYPLGQSWPSLFFADKLNSGVMGPVPALLTETEGYQLQASYGLGFMTLLYFWEQLTTEGRSRLDRIDDLGDRFIRTLLSGPTTKNIATGRSLPTYVTTGVLNPCSAPFNSSRVCAIEGALLQLEAERCHTKRTRTCFEQYFLDMGLALFLDQPPLTSYNGAQKYEIRNLDLRAMDLENNRLSPDLSTGNRIGIDFSITDSLFDDFNRETLLAIAQESENSANQTTAPPPATGVNVAEFGLSFIGLTNRNTKANVDYIFIDGVDFQTDGLLDCAPVSVMSRLFVGNQSSRTVTCPATPGSTVFSVPKAAGIGESSTGVAVFAGLGNTRLEFGTARVSQGSAVTMEPVANPPALPMIRPTVNQTSGILASVSGIEKFKDKKVIESVDRLDPNAVQQYTHSFRTINFASSNLNSLIIEEKTAVLKFRAEIQSSDGVPMELLLWVDQNYLPAAEVSSVTTTVINNPVDTQKTLEQVILLGENSFANSSQLLQSVSVPGRTTMVLRVQNQTGSLVSVNFTPCNQLNECGGVAGDYFEVWCDSDPTTIKPDCTGLGNINDTRQVSPFTTLVLPIRNKNSESSQLLSFLKPSVSISRSENNAVSVEGSGKSGCFIATAAFGSEKHKVVQKLIELRDQVLMQTDLGQLFVSLYYELSPVLARYVSESSTLRNLSMGLLWVVWSFLEFPWLWVLFGSLVVFYRLFRLLRMSAVS
ncbi:MAG: hypothetical protein H3C47_12810, partial [Candidatus Cloacimonetes bacterium]|nr:hypothetical protein [Candidatus Cloacimonadota bacterium]